MRAEGWDDQRIEIIIGALLRTGVILAAVVVLFGGVVYLAHHGNEVPNYAVFRGEPENLKSASDIVHGALGMSGQAIIQLGLLLLIATPVARVLFSAIAFAIEGDYMYVVITLVVLAVLLYSLSGGLAEVGWVRLPRVLQPIIVEGRPRWREMTHKYCGGRMAGVNLADARRVIAAAEKKAQEVGQPMNIAVADEGGNLVAHVRMDGAWIGSIDISMKKAYTSRAFDFTTKDLATHSQSGGQFFGIHVSNDCKIMIFAGGIPLKRDGKVVGAIGVSGGSGEQDHAVAEAGAAAF